MVRGWRTVYSGPYAIFMEVGRVGLNQNPCHNKGVGYTSLGFHPPLTREDTPTKKSNGGVKFRKKVTVPLDLSGWRKHLHASHVN